jgi:hypothetical protein
MHENEVMRENRTIEPAIKAYYSCLSGEEARELEVWGEFARNQFAVAGPDEWLT